MEYDKKNFDNKIFRFIYTEAMKGTAISLSYKGEKTDLWNQIYWIFHKVKFNL